MFPAQECPARVEPLSATSLMRNPTASTSPVRIGMLSVQIWPVMPTGERQVTPANKELDGLYRASRQIMHLALLGAVFTACHDPMLPDLWPSAACLRKRASSFQRLLGAHQTASILYKTC